MGQLGIWMIIFGAGSFLLNAAGREFILLMWIDMWGPMVGNVIRGGLIAVGAVLCVAALVRRSRDADAPSSASPPAARP